MPSSPGSPGSGASLFQMSIGWGEIEIQVSLHLFQAALLPVPGLEWERGVNTQLCSFSTSSLGVGLSQRQKHSGERLKPEA